jgi:hypothetical protein
MAPEQPEAKKGKSTDTEKIFAIVHLPKVGVILLETAPKRLLC